MKLYSCKTLTWLEGLSPRPPIGETIVFRDEWREEFWRDRGYEDVSHFGPDLFELFKNIVRLESDASLFSGWMKMFEELYGRFIEAGHSEWTAATASAKIIYNMIKAGKTPTTVMTLGMEILSLAAIASVVLVVVIYLFNVTKVYRVVKTYDSGRYMMRMQEFLWWADVVGHTESGRSIYTTCSQVPGYAEAGFRFDGQQGETVPDSIEFRGTWKNSWFEFPHWYQRKYENLTADFIGVCWNLGGGLYVLRLAHEDGFSEEIDLEKVETERETCIEPSYTIQERILHYAAIEP